MASWSSSVRRRAWINSSRQRATVEEPEGPPDCLHSLSTADDDEVFSDGCSTGKIENWLLGCGPVECSENCVQSSEPLRRASNIADDLRLGADAFLFNGGKSASEPGLKQPLSAKQQQRRLSSRTRHQELRTPPLNLNDSQTSSCFSSSTWKSTSSVSEVLDLYSKDAEETLLQLGFGFEEPQVTVRIPPRFFTFPSQAKGINFRLFLDSQLRRIQEEDPSLSLASRFRQVQVLTAMANAFYSLYSHVSRTPLQKLATPEFSFSSSSFPVERIERFRSSLRSEPRSPVERLKDTVSKMCLYTSGSSPRGSDSNSPQPSPRKTPSLPDVVDIVLQKTGTNKKLDFSSQSNLSGHEMQIKSAKTHQRSQVMEDKDNIQQKMKLMDETSVRSSHSGNTSVTSTISGETVITTERHLLSRQDSRLTLYDTTTADIKPAAKVTYDLICPQITESARHEPFRCQNTHSLARISSETEGKYESYNAPGIQSSVSEPGEDFCCRDVESESSNGSLALCSITVTGWEEVDVSSSSSVSSLQRSEESFLNPLTHHRLAHFSSNLQQVNSFELEEVHSAGEEDFGQSETTRTSRTSPSSLSVKGQHKGEVVRGDSLQSDSSGYADEEVGPSSDRQSN